jgi:tRNA-specific 2-thiouridylase
LDYEDKFRQSVIDDFADSYLRGETPIPCVRCNQTVKFRDLLKMAHDLGGDCLATGHYIQRKINDETGQAELHRAIDPLKDQSYFLFATTQDQLDYLRFPLGGWTKDKTRVEAERLGLVTADKPDSQDICFVPNGDYADVVRKVRPEAEKPGNIVHIDGRVLGNHSGIVNYTVGQRKGIGIGGGVTDNNEPLYVVALRPNENEVVVGTKNFLARDIVKIHDTNWLSNREGAVTVKLRSVSKPYEAILSHNNDSTSIITLNDAQYGISPGQAAVVYHGNRIIGGGWIYATDYSENPVKIAA